MSESVSREVHADAAEATASAANRERSLDPGGPKPMSFSRHTSLATCGEQYRLERVLKLDSGTGWALVGGNAFHRTVEQILRERYE